MKLAVQQTLVPGDSLVEKFRHAADYGFDGVELAAWGFAGLPWEASDEIQAAMAQTGLPVSSLCTMGRDDFVHPDPGERKKRLEGLVKMLRLAEAVGARGVVALPIRPPLHLPDLSPVADEHTLITQLALSTLASALEQTSGMQSRIFLEPLNRYEAYYLRKVSDAVALCEVIGDERLQAMGDLFHMSIEEADIGAALRAAGSCLGHIHLADTNRLEPGQGHMDYVTAFRALRAIEYGGWLSLECGLSGGHDRVLPATVKVLRRAWEEAAADA